jgi:iron complex outermembrane receptor protein
VVRDSLQFRTPNQTQRYPQPDVAQDVKSVNTFFKYSPNDEVQVLLTGGVERSMVQKIYQDNQQTPLGTHTSASQFLDASLQYKGLNMQMSYSQGKQEVLGSLGWKYRFANFDAKAEYDFFIKNLHFRPGVSYRFSAFDDKEIASIIGPKRAFLNGESHQISTLSAYFMGDYTLNKFRFGGIARADFYDVPERAYLNYNVFATYKPTDALMFRLVAGRANRGSFILDAFYNQELNFGPMTAKLLGNNNLNLTRMQSYEFGIRTPLALGLLFDMEVFRAELSDFYTSLVVPNANPMLTENKLQNIPTRAVQNGLTVSLIFLEKKTNLQVNAYATVQKTELFDAWTEDKEGNITYQDREHTATPRAYGGVNVYYRHKKISLNAQTWYMGEQVLNELSFARSNRISPEYLSVKSYVGQNLKISYHVTPSWTLFANARNIFNNGQVQTFMGDRLPTVVFAGVNLKW